MYKKLILHIGTEKTGTTSIQKFLEMNRSALMKKGVYFPKTPSQDTAPNHRKLVSYCMNPWKQDDYHIELGLTTEVKLDVWKEKTGLEISKELKSIEQPLTVLSSEHFSSRLTDMEEIKRLGSFLAPHFNEIKILIYLRRQDKYAVSLYSTNLKSGGTSKTILSNPADKSRYNYEELCTNWMKAFGKKNIIVKVFEKKEFKNSNLIDDFLNELNIKDIEKWKRIKDSNPSLAPFGQEFLRLYNEIQPRYSEFGINPSHEKVVQFLEKKHPGKPRLPERSFVIQWYDQFSESNARVAKEYLGREQLFDENFSDYPESWTSLNFSNQDFITAGIEVGRYLHKKERR